MRDLFATLFFVSVGMLIDPAFALRHLPAVVGLALFIMAAKAVLTLVALLPFGLSGKTAAFTSLGMIQIGEFSYVLANAGRAAGAISDELNSLVLTSSVLTIVLTPLAFWVAPRVGVWLGRQPLLERAFSDRRAARGLEELFHGHAVVIGYGRVGRSVAQGLRESGLTVVVIEEDLRRVREAQDVGLTVVYGDASYNSVLRAARVGNSGLVAVALPDSGATRVVVRYSRRANRTVPIVVRLAREEDTALLLRLGASAVVAPERAGARLMLEVSERALGMPTGAIEAMAGEFPTALEG